MDEKRKNEEKGFTLIEMLIVVALLGALAIGLLATIDPFEQLKKGTDTAIRNTTSELYDSAIRYYAAKGAFPWTSNITGMAASDTAMTSAPSGYIYQVINAGELKTEFINIAGGANLGKIFLTSTADLNGIRQNVTICYRPESKSFANESNAHFDSQGNSITGCLATEAGGSSCYWCVK